MREVISLHVGGAGARVGAECWDQMCTEHDIDTATGSSSNSDDDKTAGNDMTWRSFYSEEKGRVVPRCLFVDSEFEAVDRLGKTSLGRLCGPDRFLVGIGGSATTFARGYLHTDSKKLISSAMEEIRRMAEQTSFRTFMVYCSAGGGTGSGVSSQLLEHLSADYHRSSRMIFPIYSAENSTHPTILPTTTADAYNAVLATHCWLESTDLAIPIDNEALHERCRGSVWPNSVTRSDVNSLAAEVISSLTSSLRFDGDLNVDITANVAYPRLHFYLTNYAPIATGSDGWSDNSGCNTTVAEITPSVFRPDTAMVKTDYTDATLMHAMCLYRGDVVLKEVNAAISTLKTLGSVKFVDWCPTGFKCGINYNAPRWAPTRVKRNAECRKAFQKSVMDQMPGNFDANLAGIVVDYAVNVPKAPMRTVTSVTNSTGIISFFERLLRQYDTLWAKRALVDKFLAEGLEEGYFAEARQDLENLVQDYKEIGGVLTDDSCLDDGEGP